MSSELGCKCRAQKLFSTLTAIQHKGLEEISKKQTEVEWLLSAVEIFRRFSTELRDNGTACDVVASADRLHLRACDLRKHDVIRQTKLLFSVTTIVFQQSSFGSKVPTNLVGSIEERSSFKGLNLYPSIFDLHSNYTADSHTVPHGYRNKTRIN